MRPAMREQFLRPCIRLGAHIALIVSLFGMCNHMSFESAIRNKAHAARGAQTSLFSRVRSHMLRHISPSKALMTNFALAWSFAGMYRNMDFQIAPTNKSPSAYFAFVFSRILFVDHFVLAQAGSQRKYFLANVTIEYGWLLLRFVRSRMVQFLMISQLTV